MALNKLNHNYNQPLQVIGLSSNYIKTNDIQSINSVVNSASVSNLRATVINATSATIGNISNSELQFLDGVTSNVQAQLNALSLVGGVPAGSLIMYSGTSSTVPSGWLLCDGSAQSRSVFSTLFGIVGTTYGAGDGSSTFNLPDFRGRAPLGAGTGAGSSTGSFTTGAPSGTALTARALGTWGGAESHTLQTSEMPSHTHPISMVWGTGWTGGNLGNAYSPLGNNPQNNGVANATGGGGAHNNIQPSLVVNFIIKT